MSVPIVPLQQELGWSRATMSVGISIDLLLFGLTAPFSAAPMERFGVHPRRPTRTGARLDKGWSPRAGVPRPA
jgi:hypothetical protein